MELIYSMRRKPLKCEPPHFESTSDHEVIRPLCVISSCNIIAFSSTTELSDADGESWGGHVYVCDLDTPWDSHKVTSTVHPVSTLEWDSEGKQLLVATTVGDVTVYGMKDYLLNEWTSLYSANFPGEHIVKSVFFHNGRRVVAVEKKPDVPVTERIQLLRFTPTLKGFGGIACEGACIITATGLVGVLSPPTGVESTALTATECLRPARDYITAASVAHKNGNLLIAVSCARLAQTSCVRCYVCSVSPATLTLQPLPSIYLEHRTRPTSITWCLREDTDSLLIAGTTVTMWKLTERAHPVHKLLCKGPVQGSTTPGGGQKPGADCFNTVIWQQTALWQTEGNQRATCVSSCRLPLTPPHVVLATPRALHLLARDTHHYICSTPVVTCGTVAAQDAPAPAGATPPKKCKYGAGTLPSGAACAIVCNVDVSWLGGVAVAVDTHAQLHVYRLPHPAHDIPTPLSVQHMTNLLEYSMVSGYDCLDVLMTIKPTVIDNIYERFTESFHRQPQSFQQYYYHSWLKLRIALSRVSSSSQSTLSALTSLQMISASAAAAAAALRPDDKPDLAPLAALLDDQHSDHDKTLLTLEAKSDLGTDAQTVAALQALRCPLQRSLDVAVTALPVSAQRHTHGHELWTDPPALNLVRKMVVVCRAGGRGGDTLGRALQRLAACTTPKPDLLEECAMLSAQTSSARVWESLPRTCVSSPHGRSWPLYFEYGVEPDSLRYAPDPPAHAQNDIVPSLAMDSIRYMYLGGGARPARWRQCGRCGARALAPAHPARHPLQRAYDARFLPACRCGGKWTLHSNV